MGAYIISYTSKVIRLWSTTPCMDEVSNAFSSNAAIGIAVAVSPVKKNKQYMLHEFDQGHLW